MSVTFRKYNPEPLFGEDYTKLRDFLIALDSHNYHYGRWDWMITHSYLEAKGLRSIGLWEDSGVVVAVATYDCGLGNAYIMTIPSYAHLKEEMLLYAMNSLGKDGRFEVLILDGDLPMQNIARKHGFFPTQNQERDAVFPIDAEETAYSLPEGFRITSMKDTFDVYQYGQVLWRGFDHEANGEGSFVFKEEDRPVWEAEFKRPNVNLDLKIAVVAPNGDFVSYCGMWYDARSKSALVEPVATDPAYRKMGLGRAAVLEAIRRCGELGATRAYVGSSQQFYYNIGFRPNATNTWWAQK